MRYLAKGVVAQPSTEHILHIHHFGSEFTLTGLEARLWLDARFNIAETDGNNFNEEKTIAKLKKMELVEALEPGPAGAYRALTNCIVAPAEYHRPLPPITKEEKVLLRWITGAGLRLTIAELVYLTEHKMVPEAEWLGDENRQRLTEAIYTTDTIFDRVLETQMESSACRDHVVKTVLSLLKKKRVLLL